MSPMGRLPPPRIVQVGKVVRRGEKTAECLQKGRLLLLSLASGLGPLLVFNDAAHKRE